MKNQPCDTSAVALTAALLLSLPFLLPWHVRPIPSFAQEWLAFVLGLLALAAALTARRTTELLLPPVLLAPVALAAVLLQQLLLGHVGHHVNALLAIGFLLWSALLAVCARSAAANGTGALYPTLAWGALAGATLNALFGLAQYSGLSAHVPGLVFAAPALDQYGVYGNLAQANHFSTHLALGLAALAWLRAAGRIAAVPAAAAALLLLAAMALSGSRSIVLHLLWIGALWLVAPRAPGTGLPRRRLLLLGAALAVFVAGLWLDAQSSLLGPQLARLVLFSEGAGPRAYLWRHALEMAAAQPLLGVGLDRFAYSLVGQLQPGERVWEIDQYAHNLGLQLLATTGLAGFAALAVPLALFIRRLARVGLTRATLWPWSVLGVLFIHSMLEQPLYYAYFLGYAAFVAGAADPAAWRLRLGLPLRAAGLVVVLAGLAVLGQSASDYRALAYTFYSEAGDAGEEPGRGTLLAALHARSMFAPLAELIAPESIVGHAAPVAAKLAFNARLMQFAPIAEVEFRHAALLAEAGQLAAAKTQFTRAARAYPKQAAHYARRLVLQSAAAPVLGPLAVFALNAGAHLEPSP